MKWIISLFLVFASIFCFRAFAEKGYDIEATGDHSVWVIVNDIRETFQKDTGISLDLIPELAIVGKGCSKGFIHAAKGNPGREFGLVCCNFSDDFLRKKGLKLYPVAREPLAILVNKKNPVSNLSLAEVRDIFSGKITNWRQVGGKNQKIVVITQLHCRDYTPNWKGILGSPDKFTTKRLEVKTQPEMAKTVADFEQAIGHLEMTSVVEAANNRLKLLSINGSRPETEAMEKSSYPLFATLSVVTRGEAEGKVRKFIDYMRQSPRAKQFMIKYGMIQAG